MLWISTEIPHWLMYCFTVAHLNCSVRIINSCLGYSLWASCLSFSVSPLLETSSESSNKQSITFIDLYLHLAGAETTREVSVLRDSSSAALVKWWGRTIPGEMDATRTLPINVLHYRHLFSLLLVDGWIWGQKRTSWRCTLQHLHHTKSCTEL